MSRNLVVTAVVVLVLIAGGWFLMRPNKSATPTLTNPPAESPSSTDSAAPKLATDGAMMTDETLVTISSSGFSPKALTVKVGDSVTWMNSDMASHTVDSSPHPTHTDYTPLNLSTIKPGEKKSLTFPKAGTYKYHDHLNPTLFGSVTVQ